MNRRGKQGHKEFYNYSQNWLSEKILFQTAWVDRLPSGKSVYSFSYVSIGTIHIEVYIQQNIDFPLTLELAGCQTSCDIHSPFFFCIFLHCLNCSHKTIERYQICIHEKWAIILLDQDCQTYAKCKKEWFMKSLLLNFIKKSKMTYTIFCLHWIWMVKKVLKNLEHTEHNQQKSLIVYKIKFCTYNLQSDKLMVNIKKRIPERLKWKSKKDK